MLVVIAISLLKYHQSKVLSLEYEGCMQYVSRIADAPYNEDKLCKLVKKVWDKIDQSIYQALRLQYQQKHASTNPINFASTTTNSTSGSNTTTSSLHRI